MGIFDRFADIMKSNINALLDKAEDPAKMVDQMLLDLREKLADVKSNTASVMAEEKAAKRNLDECQTYVNRYADAARKAVAAGADSDARELLSKKQAKEANLPALQQAYDVAHANSDRLRQMLDKLTTDIQTLESRKDAIKATASAAKAQSAMNKITADMPDAGSSMEAFDRLEAKAQKALDKAMAESELNKAAAGDSDVLKKYESGGSASVEDELAKLKAEMGQGQ